MNKPQKRRSSGPRSFDRDKAVETAMRLFRRHGYEGVSVADLTAAIGIAPPSLYAAFGSKAGLYREALDRYAGLPGALDGLKGATTLEDAVRGLLGAAARAVTSSEPGCMLSTGLVEAAAEHQDLVHELRKRRRALLSDMADAFCLWVEKPQAERLAAYLLAIQQGMSVQSRDGASLAELENLIDMAVDGLAVFV